VCERFGQDPLTFLERLMQAPPHMLDMLVMFGNLRDAEDGARRKR